VWGSTVAKPAAQVDRLAVTKKKFCAFSVNVHGFDGPGSFFVKFAIIYRVKLYFKY